MLIVQQIAGLLLAGFSVSFMIWFLAGTLRESRSRHRRDAHIPVEAADSWQAATFSPQVPSRSVSAQRNPDKGAPRPQPLPAPQFGQSSRSLHSASR